MNLIISYIKKLVSVFAFLLVVLFAVIAQPIGSKSELRYWPGVRALHPVPVRWESLAKGFDRTVLRFEGETTTFEVEPKPLRRQIELVVFRIDTALYPVRVIAAKTLSGGNKADLRSVHRRVGAVLTVNGGYFSDAGDPMGLVISDGHTVNKWTEQGGSGAFTIFKSVPRIDWATNIAEANPPPNQAIQNGPMLIEPEHQFGMMTLRNDHDYRTVLALDKANRLLVMLTRKSCGEQTTLCGITLFEAAVILYHPEDIGGLNANAAINLDGGTSSGMEFSLGSYHDRIRMSIQVPNFVCVMPAR